MTAAGAEIERMRRSRQRRQFRETVEIGASRMNRAGDIGARPRTELADS
jgi:hypothetical protein